MGIEMKRAVIIAGAPKFDPDFLRSEIKETDFVIVADFGAKVAEQIGIIPNLAVGDFDTALTPSGNFEVIKLSPVKDCTDTHFACEQAVHRGFKEVALLNVVGSRVDHTYANFLCLNYLFEKGVNACIKNESTLAYIIDKPISSLKSNYKFLSLFSMFDDIKDLTLRGVKYPLTNHFLSATSPLCISNEIDSGVASISFSSGKLLVIETND